MAEQSILVINTGSSSLKFGLYAEEDGDEQVLFDGLADGIGQSSGTLEVKDGEGKTLRSEKIGFVSRHDALTHAAHWLDELAPGKPYAIGHRVVHGGPRLVTHQAITPELVSELQACVHFAPLHIPMALQLIAEAEHAYADVPQFACFDTAFHTTMPERAARFPLSRQLYDEGIRRYGFHGLSYESIVYQLGSKLPSRVVMAHLGSGASLAAVKDGKSVDTSMGLTPTGGIPMATRTGDLDPGVLLYLQRAKKMDADSLEKLLNHDAGLKALAGGTSDMRKLQQAADQGDHDAELAIEVFCLSIRKFVSAYAAVLGGLDMLIFAGGIGEHSVRVRRAVCEGLRFLGVAIDDRKNQAANGTISTPGNSAQVCIVPSQEDRQIARHCRALLRKS
ncbi:MAG TPA: acetate/propionate family kinase [Terriglobales bacterium]|jgi:acetate kinase